jgi:hypothetical protein
LKTELQTSKTDKYDAATERGEDNQDIIRKWI